MKIESSGEIISGLPSDLGARAKEINTRISSGEAMTIQQLADALGMPFEFVAVSIGLTQALMNGAVVIIDPAELTKLH